MNTLSKYLGLSEELIDSVTKGKVDCLPQDNSIRSNVLTKIGFLYFGVTEDKDMKLSAFLIEKMFIDIDDKLYSIEQSYNGIYETDVALDTLFEGVE